MKRRIRYRVIAIEQNLENVWSYHYTLARAQDAKCRYLRNSGTTLVDLYGYRIEECVSGVWTAPVE